MVKKLIQNHNRGIVLLQETKLASVDSLLIKSIWSSTFIGWTSLDAIDSSGVFSFFGVSQIFLSMKSYKVIFPSLFTYVG